MPGTALLSSSIEFREPTVLPAQDLYLALSTRISIFESVPRASRMASIATRALESEVLSETRNSALYPIDLPHPAYLRCHSSLVLKREEVFDHRVAEDHIKTTHRETGLDLWRHQQRIRYS
jgi:hypothetical protein